MKNNITFEEAVEAIASKLGQLKTLLNNDSKIKQLFEAEPKQRASRNMQAWSEEEDKCLRSLHEQGIKYNEIAIQMKRSYGSVCKRIHDMGVKYRRFRWTSDQAKLLFSLYDQGLSIVQISDQMKINQSIIVSKINNEGRRR